MRAMEQHPSFKGRSNLARKERTLQVLLAEWRWWPIKRGLFMKSIKVSTKKPWLRGLTTSGQKWVFPSSHQWLRQISMKLPFAVLRKSALKFTKWSKRENSISYHFLLFWFNQNLISVLKTLLSCLSEKTLWKVDSDSLYKKQGCMKSW